jgi:hypothetical protein
MSGNPTRWGVTDIPVIMVTIVDEHRRGIALGAAGYLTEELCLYCQHKNSLLGWLGQREPRLPHGLGAEQATGLRRASAVRRLTRQRMHITSPGFFVRRRSIFTCHYEE